MRSFCLVSFSIRLQNCLQVYDLATRIGGNEFVVFLDDLPHHQIAASICKRILTAMSKPFSIGGEKIDLSINIGISLYPYDTKSRHELLTFAESAMYKAKGRVGNSYEFYYNTD